MAFTTSEIQDNELSWSVSSPKSSVSDLLQLNTLDSAGDLAYIEQNGSFEVVFKHNFVFWRNSMGRSNLLAYYLVCCGM